MASAALVLLVAAFGALHHATKTIRWGQQTWEEMMIGFIGFTLDKQSVPTS